MDGGRGRSGGRRSAQGPLRRRRLRGGAPAVRGSRPGRLWARGRAALGGSFLEERCHLKEAEDRDGRTAAGIGPARSPLPPAAAAPARPRVPPAGSRISPLLWSPAARLLYREVARDTRNCRASSHWAGKEARIASAGVELLRSPEEAWYRQALGKSPKERGLPPLVARLSPLTTSHPGSFGITLLCTGRTTAYLSLPQKQEVYLGCG